MYFSYFSYWQKSSSSLLSHSKLKGGVRISEIPSPVRQSWKLFHTEPSIRNSMTLLLIHKSQNLSSRTLNYFSWLHRRQLPIFFVLLFSLNFLFSVEVVYCCFNEVADRMKVLRLYFDKSRKWIFVGWRRITCTQVPDTTHRVRR